LIQHCIVKNLEFLGKWIFSGIHKGHSPFPQNPKTQHLSKTKIITQKTEKPQKTIKMLQNGLNDDPFPPFFTDDDDTKF
jgi:hypothetical protein